MVLSSAEVVFDENAQVTDFEICYDENYGEKGSVFVMFQADDTFVFAYYDISSDTFTEYEKKLILTQTHSAIFCTEKGVLHMVVQNGLTSVQTLDYYRLTKNGEYYEQRIFSSNGNWISNNSEWVANRGFGNGGITVDEQGKVHIFAVACPSIEESAISHYIIDENGNTERSILPRLYYEDTDIMPTIGALMKDSDGSLYIFELYVDVNARNLMTIGKFEDNTYQAVSVFDIMEFPSNLYKYQIRILNGALVFISNDYDIYYCGIREVKNEISSFG